MKSFAAIASLLAVASGAHLPVHHAPVHAVHAPVHAIAHGPAYHAAPVHAVPHGPAYHPAPVHGHGAAYKETPAHYQYGYAVKDDYSGVNFAANEARDGYATNGQYSVLLPDGRTQTVTYNVADDYSGYVADVQYSGEPHYGPAPHHGAPVHHAAPVHAVHAPVHHAPVHAVHAPVHHAVVPHLAPHHG